MQLTQKPSAPAAASACCTHECNEGRDCPVRHARARRPNPNAAIVLAKIDAIESAIACEIRLAEGVA